MRNLLLVLFLALTPLLNMNALTMDSENAVSAVLSSAGYEKTYVNSEQILMGEYGIFLTDISGEIIPASFIGHDQNGLYMQLQPQTCNVCRKGFTMGNICSYPDCPSNKKR